MTLQKAKELNDWVGNYQDILDPQLTKLWMEGYEVYLKSPEYQTWDVEIDPIVGGYVLSPDFTKIPRPLVWTGLVGDIATMLKCLDTLLFSPLFSDLLTEEVIIRVKQAWVELHQILNYPQALLDTIGRKNQPWWAWSWKTTDGKKRGINET